LGESITRRFLAGMVLALVGAMMLLGSSVELGGRYVLGDGLGLATACFYGAYMIALARLRGRYGAATIMFWSSLVTSLALLPVAWLSGESVVAHSASGWLVLIALAWIGQAMGQGLIAYALGHLPASFSSLAVLVQPVTAAVLGWLLLGEALGRLQIVGGITILAGILVARAAGQRDSAV
jgi:drug/metabolite transporter (DMT)-like permease